MDGGDSPSIFPKGFPKLPKRNPYLEDHPI